MKFKSSFLFFGSLLVPLVFLFALSVSAEEQDKNPIPFYSPFLEAEHLFYAGDYDKAQILYQKYLNEKPRGARRNTALYRLGTIHQKTHSLVIALRYYRMILRSNPVLELSHKTKFGQAQCLFELGQYDLAKALFEEIALSHPDAKKKWEAKIYLGRLEEQRLDYNKSIEKLMEIYSKSDDKTVESHAEDLILQIVTQKLNKDMLVKFSKIYFSDFPLDQILLKLISIYRDERDLEKLQKLIPRFLRLFPDNSSRLALESMLKIIEGNKENILRIGVVLPLTGKRALSGQQVLQGIQQAVNEFNLITKEIELETVVKDSASGSIESMVEKIANDPSVVGIVGPVLSDSVRNVAPIADKYHMVMITPSASSSGIAELSPYIFRNALTRELQGKYIAEYAFNRLGLRRFVVLYPLEEFGFELKDFFINEVESLGGEVVSVVSYERSQNDFKNQILNMGGIDDDNLRKLIKDQEENNLEIDSLGQDGPLSQPVVEMGLWSGDQVQNLKISLQLSYDAIFIPGFYDKVGLIIPQLVFYNIDNTTLLGASGWNSPELTKMAGKYIKKGYFIDGFYIKSKSPEVVQFLEDYKKNFGEDPTILSGQAYDATKLIIKTILSGARNRVQVKKELLQIRGFNGVTGETTILPSGEVEKKLFTMKITGKQILEVN